MNTRLLLSLCALGMSLGARAQSINGTVTDNLGKPVAQAAVLLLKAADSSWLRSEVTNAQGHYSLAADAGDYLLQVAAAGFIRQTQSCSIKKDNPRTLDFKMAPQTAALEEITVRSKVPFIQAKPGMMVVNVENSAASAGSNALELLQRSPGVQVDPQGAISMRGKAGVDVYVDGRPSRLSGDQLTAYLKSMTAEEIAQLELITQPGAKYDAAGTAGIINIRTRSVRKQGLNGNLSGTASRATEAFGNLSGKITYRRNKLTLYASEYFNYVNNHNTLEVDRRFFKQGTAEPSGNVTTSQRLQYVSRFHRIKTGGEYALSDNTTIGIRAQLPIGHPEMDYNNLTSINDLPSGTTTYTSGRRSMENRWHEQELGLLGRHRFKDEGELSFDGFIVGNKSADHGLFINEQVDANGTAFSAPDLWDMSFPVAIRLISAQSDYTRPLDKKTKLEAGLKYTNVAIDNIADYRIPDNSGTFVPDTLRSTRFQYDETVAAAYGSLSRTFNPKLEAQAGLRAEQTIGEGRVVKTGESFKRDYLSLFPTLFASYKADSLNTLTFSYGRRLDRPNYYLLNPSRNYIDMYSYSVGNPRLLPQFINNFELGYSWKGELTATLSYMRADGIISDFFVQDDATKTAYEIHDNIAGFSQGGLSVNYHKVVKPWWTTNLYGDVYLREFTGNYYGTEYRQQGSSYSFNMSNQLSLGHGWNAEVGGWFNGPALNTVFTRSLALGSLDVGLSKKLLSDSLTVKLAFNDVLGTQEYHSSNRFANFDTDVSSTWDARRAVLSVNYSFGKSIDLMQRKGEAEGRRM